MKLLKGAIPLIFGGIGLFSSPAWAVPITVNNFSFELPASTNGGTGCPITGWTCSQNDTQMGVYVPVNTQYPSGANGLSGGLIVPDGSQAGYIQLGSAKFSQNTAATILDNTAYTLQVFVGHRNDFALPTNPSTGTIGLTHNGTAIAGATFTITDPGQGKWLNETISYTTTSGAGDPFQGQTLGIALIDGGASGQINFDNVRLDYVGPAGNGNAVPEPATVLLLGSGLAGLALARKKFAA